MYASGSAGPGFDPRRGGKFSFQIYQPRIAIRPSDGEVKPGGPLVAFQEEQAMSWHGFHLHPSFHHHHHPTQHTYTTQIVRHTVTLTSTYT